MKSERPDQFRVREPVEHLCDVCNAAGCFGIGWPLEPTEKWYCRQHLPTDYFTREPRK